MSNLKTCLMFLVDKLQDVSFVIVSLTVTSAFNFFIGDHSKDLIKKEEIEN